MKAQEIQTLVTLSLIGEKIKLSTIIKEEVTTEKQINFLIEKGYLITVKNKFGTWIVPTIKGKVIMIQVENLFKATSDLLSL